MVDYTNPETAQAVALFHRLEPLIGQTELAVLIATADTMFDLWRTVARLALSAHEEARRRDDFLEPSGYFHDFADRYVEAANILGEALCSGTKADLHA